MRRKDREITDRAAIEAILQRATVCHLALADGDRPYVVPVCFGYEDGRLYVHSANAGRKLDILARNPRVCFEVEVDVRVVPAEPACDWSVKYASVIGTGRAVVVENPEEKTRGLNAIVQHYSGCASDYRDGELRKVTVLRIDVEEVTGKRAV